MPHSNITPNNAILDKKENIIQYNTLENKSSLLIPYNATKNNKSQLNTTLYNSVQYKGILFLYHNIMSCLVCIVYAYSLFVWVHMLL